MSASKETVDSTINKFVGALEKGGNSKVSWDTMFSTFISASPYQNENELADHVQQNTSIKRLKELENGLHKLAEA